MQRGNVEKRKRENKSVPFAGMDLQLPSSRVSNYTFLLQPRRSQIPEAVVMGDVKTWRMLLRLFMEGLKTLSKEQLEERVREVDSQRGMEHASIITSDVSDKCI